MNRFCSILLFLALSYSISIAHPGIGIVMDSKGNVFYTDLVHVWQITPDGKRSIAVSNVHTHELFIDASDNIYGEHEWYEGEATDKWGNYVWCLGYDGTFEKVIPDVEGFLDNTTLVRDQEGNSFWSKKTDSNEELMIENSAGESRKFSQHEFNDIRWMYFSNHDQSLYVVDQTEIKKVNPHGNVESLTDDLKEKGLNYRNVADRHYVFGIWTNSHKQLFIALYGAGKVKRLNADGTLYTIYKSKPGWSPCGGMQAPDGSLWIMEFSFNNKTRVKRIGEDGSETVFEG